MELSIIMPCLNEAETLGECIKEAQNFIKKNNIKGEVVIGDNGSTDGSIEIAQNLGAVVAHVEKKGYGNASIGAIHKAKGKYIITADTDGSHEIDNIEFVEKLREGFDLVMGNRFKGEKQKDAMPFLHRYVGNPILTFIGNLFFKTNIGDFHCGIRGFTKEAFNKMDLNCSGMEFASEIVVKASLLNLNITEIPTTVFPAGRSRKPHLRTFPDGWRHLRFLLLYSPKWLFLYPGILLMFFSFFATLAIIFNNYLTIEWLPLSASVFVISFQFVVFYALTKIYAANHGLIPKPKNYNQIFNYFTLERGILLGLFTVAIGIGLFFVIDKVELIKESLKIIIPASVTIILGVQIILFSFFFSIMGLKDSNP